MGIFKTLATLPEQGSLHQGQVASKRIDRRLLFVDCRLLLPQLAVPTKELEAIATSIDEGEPVPARRVLFQHRLGKLAEAAKALAHIDWLKKQEDACLMREV